MLRENQMKPEVLTSIAAIISACTAFVAVLIGPLITSRLQHRQAVAAMREKWIYDLRHTLSELTARAAAATAVMVQSREISSDLREAYGELVKLEAKAKMMLNPAEPDHNKLQKQLEQIVALAGDDGEQAKEKTLKMRVLTEAIIPTAQSVFKEAWDNVTMKRRTKLRMRSR